MFFRLANIFQKKKVRELKKNCTFQFFLLNQNTCTNDRKCNEFKKTYSTTFY